MDDVGRALDPPARWVKAFWDQADLVGRPVDGLDGSCMTFLYELDEQGYVIRAIELLGQSQVPVGAASLAEFWEAQEYRRQAMTPALERYQARYGGVPEGSERDWGDYPHEVISSDEFEHVWEQARQYLADHPRDSHFVEPA